LRFGILPWKATALEFNQQMVDAMDGINRFSAPLPPDSHLTLFAVSVIAAAGLLVHLVTVQLRQAAWAGLLLLTMYTVPAATVHGGLPGLLFIPPAVGYIVLLSAEGRTRLSRWGRRISGVSHLDSTGPIEASALGQAGRRIGLSVVALAALVPALLPALPEGVVGNGLAGGTGGGLGASISATDPMLDMGKNLKRGDNVTALTYTGDPTYLRLTALDSFDGNTWRISPRQEGQKVNGDLSPPPGFSGDLSKAKQTKLQVEVSRNFRSQFVPVPYPLRSISLKNRWRYDASSLDIVSSNGQVVGGQDYSATAYDLTPTPEQLRDSVASGAPDQYTSQVPARTPERIRRLAQDITAEAQGNHFEQAVLLQKYFRSGEFTYSTATGSQSGMRALEAFLLVNKTGYCEQFATGMALLARTLGIPARVGIGFLPGQDGKDGEHIVRMHDMHAWPELYFQGSGWIRFEPTPAQRVADTPAWTDSAGVPGGPEVTAAPPAVPTAEDSAAENPLDRPNPNRNLPDDNGIAVAEAGGWWSHDSVRIAAGVTGGLLVLCIPWLIRTLVRRRRFARPPGRIAVEGLWAEVRDTARDLGLDWSDTATPRQLGEWLGERLPDGVRPQVNRLARGVESVRYAAHQDPTVDLRAEANAVRRSLWARAKFSSRWRARLLPPSWRWYLNRGSSEATDLLDAFDLILARLRSAVLPRRHAN
jgi:transglutaminase-like putative cysteine protease